ncbi:hypothetical protein K504DRAFT_504370 [Pleomassaria siparia CBS 279.74]|uniref:Uncharacterized protein n=1 Tax=Pleomassaria siparia CBS 279.74 TaxID=1314801 RepID=A0A6G1K2V8_9PLEO|nr:hypothetical protein K504DRAFT_504370 [Pleomassaria siparia CBS 279.74]
MKDGIAPGAGQDISGKRLNMPALLTLDDNILPPRVAFIVTSLSLYSDIPKINYSSQPNSMFLCTDHERASAATRNLDHGQERKNLFIGGFDANASITRTQWHEEQKPAKKAVRYRTPVEELAAKDAGWKEAILNVSGRHVEFGGDPSEATNTALNALKSAIDIHGDSSEHRLSGTPFIGDHRSWLGHDQFARDKDGEHWRTPVVAFELGLEHVPSIVRV